MNLLCPVCGVEHPADAPHAPQVAPVAPPQWVPGVTAHPRGYVGHVERYGPEEDPLEVSHHDIVVCDHYHRHHDTALSCARKLARNV
jgi:hypothetical protein